MRREGSMVNEFDDAVMDTNKAFEDIKAEVEKLKAVVDAAWKVIEHFAENEGYWKKHITIEDERSLDPLDKALTVLDE